MSEELVIQYKASLTDFIDDKITWEEHHSGAREQMLLAFCRGYERKDVGEDLRNEISALEIKADAKLWAESEKDNEEGQYG